MVLKINKSDSLDIIFEKIQEFAKDKEIKILKVYEDDKIVELTIYNNREINQDEW